MQESKQLPPLIYICLYCLRANGFSFSAICEQWRYIVNAVRWHAKSEPHFQCNWPVCMVIILKSSILLKSIFIFIIISFYLAAIFVARYHPFTFPDVTYDKLKMDANYKNKHNNQIEWHKLLILCLIIRYN